MILEHPWEETIPACTGIERQAGSAGDADPMFGEGQAGARGSWRPLQWSRRKKPQGQADSRIYGRTKDLTAKAMLEMKHKVGGRAPSVFGTWSNVRQVG